MFSILIRPFGLRPRAVAEASAPRSTTRVPSARRAPGLRLRWQRGKSGRICAYWTIA